MPSNLLITRRWQNRIRPVYAKLNLENLGVAKLLIQTYMDFIGRKKGELDEAVDSLEKIGYDYRYVRGLSTLLDHHCQLESRAAIDPVKARKQVFKIANKGVLPTTSEARKRVLYQAATELGVTMKELDEALYGDLEEELILKGFESVDPNNLVRKYNLSLTQTLLFSSTELIFTVIGNWQRIFRKIKWLGLIYKIWRNNREYQVKVDGPTSLFKLNRRYGTSLAKLLPTIVQSQEWSIKAKILRHKGDKRLLNLELNRQKHGKYIKTFEPPEEIYDSQVEQEFARRFRVLDTGWSLSREPEPILVGNRVMIPDFGFQKANLKVYMEVVGFWTPQYLKEKIKKLSLLDNIDMIVAADRDLACQKLDRMRKKLNVIYYRQRVPLSPIIAHLKAKEEHLVKEQIGLLRSKDFIIKKTVVEARELAEKLGVLEEAMKEILREKEVPGYKFLGNMLIMELTLKEILERLEKRMDQGELSLKDASKIIEEEGGRKPTSILDALGYKIEWYGIDPESAKVQRKKLL